MTVAELIAKLQEHPSNLRVRGTYEGVTADVLRVYARDITLDGQTQRIVLIDVNHD
jgi:hypothetical protein